MEIYDAINHIVKKYLMHRKMIKYIVWQKIYLLYNHSFILKIIFIWLGKKDLYQNVSLSGKYSFYLPKVSQFSTTQRCITF